MKSRIPTSALQVGMFIDSMDGSWWLNPFWKRSFLVSNAKQLAQLAESGIEWVVIDDSRGAGLRHPDADDAPAAPSMAVPFSPAPRQPAARAGAAAAVMASPGTADFALQRARAVVEQSKDEIKQLFADVRLGRVVQPDALRPIVDGIQDVVEQDVGAMLRVTRLKKKNEYTYMHSVAVSALMIALARYLRLDDETVRELGLAGLLHDIGKVAVPGTILDKPDRLTDAELKVIRTHPEQGLVLLKSTPLSPVALDVVAHHHEKLDGTGYPHALAGEAISLHARIAAVCDVYDAVTSKRSYKRTWTPSEALTRMRSWGGHFDPVILDAFMRCIAIYPVGLLVRLRSNRLAVVRTENVSEPTRPIVRAFYSIADHTHIDPVDLRLSPNLKGDSVVAIEDGMGWFPHDWEAVAAQVDNGERYDPARIVAPVADREDVR